MQTKIVTMLLSAMLLSTGVTGTQQIKSTDITEPVTRESEVKYKQESNFTVTIPKKIALSSGKTAEYAVTVSGSVGANEKVSVTPDSTFTMNETSNRKTAVTGNAIQEDTVWDYQQIEASEVKNGNVTASGLTAGDWSGNLTFNINLDAEYIIGDDVELTRDNLEEYSIPTEGDVVIPEMVLGSDGMKHKVTSIGAYAFNAKKITSITLPNNVTNIGMGAFASCRNLATVILPDSITSIGEYAFRRCVTLETINIPKSMSTISENAFSGCQALKHIEIPNNITQIENDAFKECAGLTEVTIPNTVTKIGGKVFSSCTNLTQVNIPENMTNIPAEMFANCTSLKSIKLPNGLTTIEMGAFRDCKVLENIEIPNGVTKINENAFKGCTSLKNIEIPDTVTTIGNQTFANCTSVENITIPNDILNIGDNAFYNVKHITYHGTKLNETDASWSPWGALSMN